MIRVPFPRKRDPVPIAGMHAQSGTGIEYEDGNAAPAQAADEAQTIH
jgi:hypothetical protein